MKKILVPCDFSSKSKAAIKFAIDLAAKAKGEVTLLHVIYSSPLYQPLYMDNIAGNPINVLDYIDQMKNDAKEELSKLQNSLTNDSVKIKIHTSIGDIDSAIIQKADELGSDLIVMGTTGSSGMEELLIGSVTEKIVRRAKIPVIAVRKTPKIEEIKKILFPSNLENGQEELVKKVKELQRFFDAELHLLLVNTPTHFRPEYEAREDLNRFVKHHQLQKCTTHFISHWTAEKGILDYQSKHDMDMIIMSTHGRKGLQHIFYGSITEDVVNHISCPIWTYQLHPKSK